MKNIFLALLLMVLPTGFYSCAAVGPAEPADTDTLEDRAEPKYLDKEYNPEVEEEIESDINPLETQEDEDAPLIK